MRMVVLAKTCYGNSEYETLPWGRMETYPKNRRTMSIEDHSSEWPVCPERLTSKHAEYPSRLFGNITQGLFILISYTQAIG